MTGLHFPINRCKKFGTVDLQPHQASFKANGYMLVFFCHIFWGSSVGRLGLVKFQCWGILLFWIIVGQGSTMLAVSGVGGCLYWLTA